MERFRALIGKAATGAALTRDEAAHAFDKMMSGEATPAQMGGLLMALRLRGETVDEITGAVSTMRGKMLTVEAPADAIDVVGTGGDAAGSYNISTCAAFIRELLRKAALFAADEGPGAPVVMDRHLDEAVHELVVAGGELTKSLLGAR